MYIIQNTKIYKFDLQKILNVQKIQNAENAKNKIEILYKVVNKKNIN